MPSPRPVLALVALSVLLAGCASPAPNDAPAQGASGATTPTSPAPPQPVTATASPTTPTAATAASTPEPTKPPPAAATAREVFVSPEGTDDGPGTAAAPFATVAHALDAATPGTTITIRAGVYRGNPVLDASGADGAPIVIRSAPGASVVLDGEGADDSTGLWLRPNVSHVVIEGLEIRNYRGYALFVEGPNENVTLRSLDVHDSDTGLRFTEPRETAPEVYVTSGEVRRVLIADVWTHHHALAGVDCAPGPCNTFRIERVRSTDNGDYDNTAADGFAWELGSEVLVVDSEAARNGGDGFDFKGDRTSIRNGYSHHNARDGIKLWGEGTSLVDSTSVRNGQTGLVLAEGGSWTVSNNVIAFNPPQGENYGAYVAYDWPRTGNLEFYNNAVAFNRGPLFIAENVTMREDHNVYWANGERELTYAPNERRGLQVDFTTEDVQAGAWARQTGLGDGTRAVDPMFADAANDDYRLLPGSPLLGAGRGGTDVGDPTPP